MELPIPGFPDYTVTEHGDIKSYRTSNPKLLRGSIQKRSGRKRTQLRITLFDSDGKYHKVQVERLLGAAIEGRWLEPWEDVCHIDGNPLNIHLSNLRVSDRINNSIDDIENGTRQTSAEYIDEAIERLIKIRAQYQSG